MIAKHKPPAQRLVGITISTATVKLSLLSPRKVGKKQVYWQAFMDDTNLAKSIDDLIENKFEALAVAERTYTLFVSR